MTQHPRKTLFISDLHLEDTRPAIAEKFINLLNNSHESVDAVYILGDFFEAWIGDDDDTPFHRQIIHALKATTARGILIYFMHGNRDFLLGKKFFRETGCKLLAADEEKINVYGTPVLIMHGDTLCTRDIQYLKARRLAKIKFFQTLFLLLPLKFRRNVAVKMRAKSMRHTSITAKEIMDVTHAEVARVMQKHHVQYLIHGHTHRPAIHELMLDNEKAYRIVLNAWHDHGGALVWYEDGKKELIEF